MDACRGCANRGETKGSIKTMVRKRRGSPGVGGGWGGVGRGRGGDTIPSPGPITPDELRCPRLVPSWVQHRIQSFSWGTSFIDSLEGSGLPRKESLRAGWWYYPPPQCRCPSSRGQVQANSQLGANDCQQLPPCIFQKGGPQQLRQAEGTTSKRGQIQANSRWRGSTARGGANGIGGGGDA